MRIPCKLSPDGDRPRVLVCHCVLGLQNLRPPAGPLRAVVAVDPVRAVRLEHRVGALLRARVRPQNLGLVLVSLHRAAGADVHVYLAQVGVDHGAVDISYDYTYKFKVEIG